MSQCVLRDGDLRVLPRGLVNGNVGVFRQEPPTVPVLMSANLFTLSVGASRSSSSGSTPVELLLVQPVLPYQPDMPLRQLFSTMARRNFPHRGATFSHTLHYKPLW